VTRFVGPELLDAGHQLEDFDCGDATLNRWLVERARPNQAEGGSRTWVVTAGGRVVASYASTTAVLLRAEATTRVRRNQPEPVPALLLARLAVELPSQRLGLGAALLKHFILKGLEVAQLTGVHVLLVHAADEVAAAWYGRFDFEPSPVDDLTLMLLVKDVAFSL
jgi:predicted N-acetyltransferase YhbS